jgi:hypothetical protein
MRKFPTNYLLHPSSSGYVKVLPTKVPPVGLLTVASALVMAKGSAKVLPSGLTKKTVVEKFLSAAQSERNIRHEWMTVKAWASIINKECPINGHTVGADDVHESIRRDPRYRAQDMDGALNGVGVYRHRMTADTGKKVWCYQYRGFDAAGNAFGRKDEPVKVGAQWSDCLYNPFRMERGAWPEEGLYDRESESDRESEDSEEGDESRGSDNTPTCTAGAMYIETERSPSPVVPEGFAEDESPQDAEFFDTSELPPDTSIYWLSEDAIQLFLPKGEETTISAVERRKKICLAVFQGDVPVEDVVQGHSANCELSESAKNNLKLRCGYIYWALSYRLEKKNAVQDGTCRWVDHCCKYAVDKLAAAGLGKIKNPETVARWHATFRVLDKFPLLKREQRNLPQFLAANDDIKEAIQTHARQHLDDSISLIHTIYDYIHETLLPKMVEESENFASTEDLLKNYGLVSLCHETVRTWILKLGFSYDVVVKSYYVDGHEKVDTVRYRWKFIDRYLTIERRMHRWIQMTEEESKQHEGIGEDKVVPGSGYRYRGIDPNANEEADMVEYHVDALPKFQEIVDASGERGKYGGWLSVRMNPGERPVVCIGQDEAIFKQYIFTTKVWQYQGQKRLLPKDEGMGVMVSAFQSREFGFGYELREEDLEIVNAYRQTHNTYTDTAAAKVVNNNSDQKKPLTLDTNPFCLEFEYGSTAEGYWTYDHMVTQLEDCADVLKALHPEFDFVFLFDHSCGHDRGREDGLNVSYMNSGYGGNQRTMHSTKIKAEKGYLGKYQRTLNVGDVQHMVFQEGDEGPFWLTPEQRLATKHSEYHGIETKDKTKSELFRDLREKGVQPIGMKGRKVLELKEMAREKGIELTKQVRREKVRGWMGRPKGLLQILWERGFIDTSKENWRTYYSLNGTTDARDNLVEGTSLKRLMTECLDFIEEESLLQKTARQMSDGDIRICVDRTPKCHPELAGEGIEYSWGAAKNYYRRLPIADKKGKENFKNSVRSAISRDHLTTDRIRKFSRRARQYIVAYKLLKMDLDGDAEGIEDELDEHQLISKISAKKIEDMKSSYKTHRCAADFDAGFINLVCKGKEV